MRLFEILILASVLFSLIFLFFSKKNRPVLLWSVAIQIFILICHVAYEGVRWQMVPAYLYLLLILIITVIFIFRSSRIVTVSLPTWRRLIRDAGRVLAFLIWIVVTLPPLLLPVFKIPEPSGEYTVGTTTLFFRDSSRLDLHAEETGKYREICARVWYPAYCDSYHKPTPYMESEEARYMAEHMEMPSFFLSHFALVKTESCLNGIPLEGKFPIVFYSPSGDLIQNTALFQELASQGYIVISVGHPYWNAFYYGPEGQIVPFDSQHAYYQAMWEEERSEIVNSVKEEITTSSTLPEKREAQKKLNKHMPLETADIRLWSEDLSFLLDQLEVPDPDKAWLLEHMDINRVGVIGFSKGGAAAGQFSVTDPRCRAAINLSGFMFGDPVENPIQCPLMILENIEEWCEDCAPICELFYEDAQNDAYMVRIKGASHGNFSDWSLVGRFLKIIGVTGPMNGKQCLKIQQQYIRSFFDRYLKESDESLLLSQGPHDPRVLFSSRNLTMSLN